MGQEVFKNAPDWAQWFAVDGDDKAYWYKHKPFELSFQWCASIDSFDNDYMPAGIFKGLNWLETLTERQNPQQ